MGFGAGGSALCYPSPQEGPVRFLAGSLAEGAGQAGRRGIDGFFFTKRQFIFFIKTRNRPESNERPSVAFSWSMVF